MSEENTEHNKTDPASSVSEEAEKRVLRYSKDLQDWIVELETNDVLLSRFQQMLERSKALCQIPVQDTLRGLPTDQLIQKYEETGDLAFEMEWDWEEIQDRSLAVPAELPESIDATIEQLKLRRIDLEWSARRLDPGVDAHYRAIFTIKRVASPLHPPAPSLLRLREGEAPKIAAGSAGEPERDLTYADMQDWPFGPQFDALLHAYYLDLDIESANRLVRNAIDADESFRVVFRTVSAMDDLKAGIKRDPNQRSL